MYVNNRKIIHTKKLKRKNKGEYIYQVNKVEIHPHRQSIETIYIKPERGGNMCVTRTEEIYRET